jgi:anaerobic ribonucleoside-triphosphate reductase
MSKGGACEKCGKEKVPACPECGKPVELYSRIVGYMRPVTHWNPGKQQEFRDRTEFAVRKTIEHQKGE